MSPHSQRSAAISAAFLAGALAAAVPSASSAAEYSGYVDLGVEQQKTDWLMLIEPGFSMRSEMFDLNIAVPLRFDLSDSFNIWKKDWDHLSDAGRVLRNASLRMNDDAFRMKLGVLTHTSFGHGEIKGGSPIVKGILIVLIVAACAFIVLCMIYPDIIPKLREAITQSLNTH